jgi:hypothetical protein
MSLPIMVVSELGEHLLHYIMATAEVMSMVLATEGSEPKLPQVSKGAPAAGSGSQDLGPAEGPRDQEAYGSQILEPTQSHEPQMGFWLSEAPSGPKDQEASVSKISEPTLGPDSQHTIRSQLPKVPSGPGDQEPQAPEPMEIDPPDPSRRVQIVQ